MPRNASVDEGSGYLLRILRRSRQRKVELGHEEKALSLNRFDLSSLELTIKCAIGILTDPEGACHKPKP